MARETGFPSPAQGYESAGIDLNSFLIQNRPATFLMRVTGSALQHEGIHDGDILLIDRSRTPRPGMLLVFRTDGEFLCRKLLRIDGGFTFALTDEVEHTEYDGINVFGPVTAVIRKL